MFFSGCLGKRRSNILNKATNVSFYSLFSCRSWQSFIWTGRCKTSTGHRASSCVKEDKYTEVLINL